MAKVGVDGIGRIDLEDIAPYDAVLVTAEEERLRAGEGVAFDEMDVLFGKLRPYLRKSILCTGPGACSPELLVLRPDRSQIEPRFLHFVVRSAPFAAWAEATSRGTKMPRTDFKALGRFEFHLPPLDEQSRIADYLGDAERGVLTAMDQKRRLEALLSERMDALYEEVFSGAGPRSRLKWYVNSISQGVSPQAEDRPATASEWSVLKLSAVHRGRFRPSEHKALSSPPQGSVLVPMEGDLLVTRSNTPKLVGDCCVVDESAERLLLPDLIYRLRLDSTRALPRYVMHFLLSPSGRSKLRAVARGTSQSMVKLRGADILNVKLPLPRIQRQAEISEYLDRKLKLTADILGGLEGLENRLRERQLALITSTVGDSTGVPLNQTSPVA